MVDDRARIERHAAFDQRAIAAHVNHFYVRAPALAALVAPCDLEPAAGVESLVESVLRAAGAMS